VQNNKTLLLASVAQNTESKGRTGLPLLGLIPILGRLFTAPTRDNRQVDIVIAVTPRVIRAPAIYPEDEIERPTGSIAVPTSGSLEAMIIQEEREEYLASVRRLPTMAQVQLPDQPVDGPAYVRSNEAENTQPSSVTGSQTLTNALNLRPIDSSVKTLQIGQTADTGVSGKSNADPDAPPMAALPAAATPTAELVLPASLPTLRAGEKARVAIMVNSTSEFRSTVLGLRFDERRLAIRSVAFGDVFGQSLAGQTANPFLNQNGKMFVSLSVPDGATLSNTGILAFVEVEALVDGEIELKFERDVLNVLSPNGKNFALRY
jgi:hypothetical protein